MADVAVCLAGRGRGGAPPTPSRPCWSARRPARRDDVGEPTLPTDGRAHDADEARLAERWGMHDGPGFDFEVGIDDWSSAEAFTRASAAAPTPPAWTLDDPRGSNATPPARRSPSS